MPAYKWAHPLANNLFVVVRDKVVVSANATAMHFDCGTRLAVVQTAMGVATVTGQFMGIGALVVADRDDVNVFERCDARHGLGTLGVCWAGKGGPECTQQCVRFADGTEVCRSQGDDRADFTYAGSGVLGMEYLERVLVPPGAVQGHYGWRGEPQVGHVLAGRLGGQTGAGA